MIDARWTSIVALVLLACGDSGAAPDADVRDAMADGDMDDPCSRHEDDCSPEATCEATATTFVCRCPRFWVGEGRGVGGCAFDDASLSLLEPSAGELLTPLGATSDYGVMVGTDPSITLRVAVTRPELATITVDGVAVASGESSPPIAVGPVLAPTRAVVRVMLASGRSRTYEVRVSRRAHYVKAATPMNGDYLGRSVASSSDGSIVAAGATQPGIPLRSGLVVVGSIAAGTVVESVSGLTPDQLGASCALSGDAHLLVAGAPAGRAATAPGYPRSGRVVVFDADLGTPLQELAALHPRVDAGFGASVAISADGSTIAIGAPGDASSGTGVDADPKVGDAPASGAVLVFARTGSTWSQTTYVKAPVNDAHDLFGTAVALSADGTVLVVGAPGESSHATGFGGDASDDSAAGAGAVYVLRRSGTWAHAEYLKASDTHAGDALGTSVAVSADGRWVAAGAPHASTATAMDVGAAYLFGPGGTTRTTAKLAATHPTVGDAFGASIALSADGAVLAAGAPRESSASRGAGGDEASNGALWSGAVFLFDVGTLEQRAYVKAPNADAGDAFGASVALSADGTVVVVGAPNEDGVSTGVDGAWTSNTFFDVGAAYVFGP